LDHFHQQNLVQDLQEVCFLLHLLDHKIHLEVEENIHQLHHHLNHLLVLVAIQRYYYILQHRLHHHRLNLLLKKLKHYH
tara:strand:- start:131 stop:367 length:237 start_codon:yes stop_codon:yes gene_type:complete